MSGKLQLVVVFAAHSFERIDKLKFVGQFRKRDMKSLTEVIASLLLALVLLRASGSLFGIIYEWKLRAGKF
jgi:hypothetical protein